MSREKILQAIRANKPSLNPHPVLPVFERDADAAVPAFMEMVEKSGGKVHLLATGETVAEIVQRYYPAPERTICRVADLEPGNVDLNQIERLTDLHGLDLAILPAQVGVAENAAVWLSEAEMGQRVVPFIAEHLVLVLKRENVVSDMHEAYKRIEVDHPGFGVFIAGPSKTADIEQSLVIGAQGPRTWLVILV